MTWVTLLLGSAAWAATGSIRVESAEEGGQILLDGFPTGAAAPTTLENVPTGKHEVELKVGCGVGRADATVKADQTTKVTVKLEKTDGVGTVRLSGLPEGARVRVDGEEVDAASGSFEALCGARVVTVSAPGFSPLREEVVVTVEEWSTVAVALQRGEMGDGAAAGGARTGSSAFDDALDEDFAFDEPAGRDDDRGDDDFLAAAPVAPRPAAARSSDDDFLDDGTSSEDDGYVPPSVAAALAGKAPPPVPAGASAAPATEPKPTAKPAKEPKPAREPKPAKEPKPAREPEPAKEPKPAREPKPAKEPKPEKAPRARSGDGPTVAQWATLGASSALTIGGATWALVEHQEFQSAERAWTAAVYGEQSGEIIVAAFDRMEAARSRRTTGWVLAGVGLAGVAGGTTWTVLTTADVPFALTVRGRF